MDHGQYMVNKSLGDEDWCSGHALLATATPIEHVREHGMDKQYPHRLPDMPKPDLAKMLNLCASLPGLNEEVTPVMAWAYILGHPRCQELSQDDFNALKKDLKPKVVCYGFGAVMEDFDLKDALTKILASKHSSSLSVTGSDMDWEMIAQ